MSTLDEMEESAGVKTEIMGLSDQDIAKINVRKLLYALHRAQRRAGIWEYMLKDLLMLVLGPNMHETILAKSFDMMYFMSLTGSARGTFKHLKARLDRTSAERDELRLEAVSTGRLLKACKSLSRRVQAIMHNRVIQCAYCKATVPNAQIEAHVAKCPAHPMAAEVALADQLGEALAFTSGSQDFAPEGKAHEGWMKIGMPAMKAWRTARLGKSNG